MIRMLNNNVLLRRLGDQERRKYDGDPESAILVIDHVRKRGEEIRTDQWGEVIEPPADGSLKRGDIVAFDATYSAPCDQFEHDGRKVERVQVEHVLAVWE